MGEVIPIQRRKRAGPRWRMASPGYHYLERWERGPGSGWRTIAVISRGADGWWWWVVLPATRFGPETCARSLSPLPIIKARIMRILESRKGTA